MLKKNGYVLEQLYSPLIGHTTPEHAELKEICRARLNARSSRGNEAHSGAAKSQSLLTPAAAGLITKHHSHPYFNFAETQWKLFLKTSPRRVKPLLCGNRVLLTGIHLRRTGELQANLVALNEEFCLPCIADLVARKLVSLAGESLRPVAGANFKLCQFAICAYRLSLSPGSPPPQAGSLFHPNSDIQTG